MLSMAPAVAATIAAHAEAAYPEECVGLLLGYVNGAQKTALEAYPVENRWSGQVRLSAADDPTSRRDRFYLDPRDYLRADREAQARGMEIIGCYHSHPDAPAVPSERDRIGAQAIGGSGFAFVIQAVHRGCATALTSWVLMDEGAQFVEEPIVMNM